MLQTSRKTSHSAIVQLTMEHGDAVIRLSQVGPEWIIAKTPVELPPCEATIVVVVDGNERRTAVRLPQGMSPANEETPIQILKL